MSQENVEIKEVEGWLARIRKGRIWRIEQYAAKREALEAAGLAEWSGTRGLQAH